MESSNVDGPQNMQENPFIPNNSKPDINDRRNARYYFFQYCSATSIHGIQYLGERSRFIVERLFWMAIIITVTTLCLILIVQTYNKWVTSPVIVTFATTETSIGTIPFPSITICPEVKTNPEVFNYTKVYVKNIMSEKLTSEEKKYKAAISLLCQKHQLFFEDNSDFVDDADIIKFKTMSPVLDPLGISSVSWIGNNKDPYDYIDFIFTSEGVCYNFNMLHIEDILTDPEEYSQNVSVNVLKIKDWSLDGGYPNKPINESYPRRTVVTGVNGGFLFDSMFVNNSHLDYICGDSLQGFKVVLHHPADWPNLDKHIRVPLDSAVLIGIKPRLTTISDELKDYSPENRKCYLINEKKLLYFKIYTQYNCMEECFANYTLKKCSCQAFYMPKLPNTPICSARKSKCVGDSKVNFLKEDGPKCACLPSCTSLEYDLELTQSDWNWQEAFNVFRKVGFAHVLTEYENIHLSKLGVYFKELQFLSSERHELYGVVDFLSNIGGLMGLFIGFSVTSFVEILYFCTLWLLRKYRKFGRKFWSGKPELFETKEIERH